DRTGMSGGQPLGAPSPGTRNGAGGVHPDSRHIQLAIPPGGATKVVGERSRASNRVTRGGSWNNDARNYRGAKPIRNTPDNRSKNLGFRLARAPQVERMLCPTEPTAFPVPLPAMCSGQIVTWGPSSAGSRREGSGRSFLAQALRLGKNLYCL